MYVVLREQTPPSIRLDTTRCLIMIEQGLHYTIYIFLPKGLARLYYAKWEISIFSILHLNVANPILFLPPPSFSPPLRSCMYAQKTSSLYS